MDNTLMKKNILDCIEKPDIPDRTYMASDMGVLPCEDRLVTAELQRAIDSVSENGGGHLILGEGVYHVGAIVLKNCVDLHLESHDTILKFTNEDIDENYPLRLSHWEASPCYNYSPLIYAYQAHDIALTGDGILDGGASSEHWWNWHHQVEAAWSTDEKDMQLEDRELLRRMNEEAVPVKERIFGKGHYLRPNFVQPIECERIMLQGFTIHNSPMWQLNPVLCKSLTIDGVTLQSHGANNDGCDPESCNLVHIKNCKFDTGDDCISLKSGRDRDGRTLNIPCTNIVIEDNVFADGHGGIAMGSEMSGGIKHVIAMHNHFDSPNLTYALRLKTNARRGGTVEDIVLCDSTMDHVHGAAVHGTMVYEDGRNGEYMPTFRDIRVENIEAHGGDYGIFLEAFDEVPITGLVLKHIHIDGVERTIHGRNWQEPIIEDVTINGEEYPRPTKARILGVPVKGTKISATADMCISTGETAFVWSMSDDGIEWTDYQVGRECLTPNNTKWIRVSAMDEDCHTSTSCPYRILMANERPLVVNRLMTRGILREELAEKLSVCDKTDFETKTDRAITRAELAELIVALDEIPRGILRAVEDDITTQTEDVNYLQIAIDDKLLVPLIYGSLSPNGNVTREEMATVAMQTCGINYRNASSTMPVCSDVDEVSYNLGTNVARSLYFGFMHTDEAEAFRPKAVLSVREALEIIDRVADFSGI